MRSTTRYTVYFFLLLLVIYFAMLDSLAKPLFERQASDMYGAEITVSALEVSPFVGKVTLYDLQVPDRRYALRNLAVADRVYIDIHILRLAEDVVDVEELTIEGLTVFAPRDSEAVIHRPLLAKNDPIVQAGRPDFNLPDVDTLIARQQKSFLADIDALKSQFSDIEAKWRVASKDMPNATDLEGYRSRIEQLQQQSRAADPLGPSQELLQVYAELQVDIEGMQLLQQRFRGDLQMMRELMDEASQLPEYHTNQLMGSIGLSNAQVAQLSSRMLRGDLGGLLQQVLAPLAYNQSGAAKASDDMPIKIDRAMISGQLLHSAPGLKANGELLNFGWPLGLKSEPTTLAVVGRTPEGGELRIRASVDHRGEANDSVNVAMDNISLRDMPLAGSSDLGLTMEQAIANVQGEMTLTDNQLSGRFNQSFADAIFQTTLGDNAGGASRLIAASLQNTRDFQFDLGLTGTVFEPHLSYSTNLDDSMANNLQGFLEARVAQLTNELNVGLSREIGPAIAEARDQLFNMETLQVELQKSLDQLAAMSRR